MKLQTAFFLCILFLFISLFSMSCAKKEKKKKIFQLNKNIEFSLKENKEINNNAPFEILEYKLEDKDQLVYHLNSQQLFTSTSTQILFDITFNIHLKKVKTTKEFWTYKVYLTNFSVTPKLLKGYIDFKPILKKYDLAINALYFNVALNKYGHKKLIFENKVALNSTLKSLSSMVFNSLNLIFPILPDKKITKTYTVSEESVQLTNQYDENGSLILTALQTTLPYQLQRTQQGILLSSTTPKRQLRQLFSLKNQTIDKANALFIDGDQLNFENENFKYQIKNYFFIQQVYEKEKK